MHVRLFFLHSWSVIRYSDLMPCILLDCNASTDMSHCSPYIYFIPTSHFLYWSHSNHCRTCSCDSIGLSISSSIITINTRCSSPCASPSRCIWLTKISPLLCWRDLVDMVAHTCSHKRHNLCFQHRFPFIWKGDGRATVEDHEEPWNHPSIWCIKYCIPNRSIETRILYMW